MTAMPRNAPLPLGTAAVLPHVHGPTAMGGAAGAEAQTSWHCTRQRGVVVAATAHGAVGAAAEGTAPPWGEGGGYGMGERMWSTAGTTRGGAGHLGLTRTETQRGRLRMACGRRCVDSKNSQTTPATTSTTPYTPTTGLRERGNDTSRSTGRSGRQNAATRRNMRREERVTVQGPPKKQQPDGMSHRGGGGGVCDRLGEGGLWAWVGGGGGVLQPSPIGPGGASGTWGTGPAVRYGPKMSPTVKRRALGAHGAGPLHGRGGGGGGPERGPGDRPLSGWPALLPPPHCHACALPKGDGP